ncbi:MAG: large conductance mechanosensitive channel protein MscL [Gemmatimonadales bacterium]|jgi:large conductance mechanosensitive channel
MLKEFKEFAAKGNVLDMAVGIVIGAAFGTIVKSFVDQVLMPPIGLALGRVDFSNLYVQLAPGDPTGPYASLAAAQDAGAVVIAWGAFLNAVISFLIIAFCVFLVVKGYNRMMREDEQEETPAAPPEPPAEEKLLTEIRDLLKARG